DHQKDQAYIRQDIEKYNERWPVRQDSIEGDIHLQDKVPDKEYVASFTQNFYHESAPRAIWTKGQFTFDLDITIVDGMPKIVGIRVKMLPQQKGKLNPAMPNTSPPLSIQATPSEGSHTKLTLWSHNGSTVVLKTDGTRVSFVYRQVRSALSGTVSEGAILFE